MSETLSLWTVYEKPADFPNHYVARRFEVQGIQHSATNDHIVADSLGSLRNMLPQGLRCIPRFPQDDPHIVEVWI